MSEKNVKMEEKLRKKVWAINLFINISLNVTWSEHKKNTSLNMEKVW